MQNLPKIETVEQARKVLEHGAKIFALANPGASDGRGVR